MWLDVMNGCLRCGRCLHRRGNGQPLPELDAHSVRSILLPVDGSTVASMRYVLRTPIERIFSFTPAEGESRIRFCRAAEAYLLNHLERGFESLEFYHSVMSVAEKRKEKKEAAEKKDV